MYSAKVIGPRARMRAARRSVSVPTPPRLAATSGDHDPAAARICAIWKPRPLQLTTDTAHLPWRPANPAVLEIPAEKCGRRRRLGLRGHTREEVLDSRCLRLVGREGPRLETLREEDVPLRDVVDHHSHAPTIWTVASIPIAVRECPESGIQIAFQLDEMRHGGAHERRVQRYERSEWRAP